jgi:multidrug efflux system outer membrane protein
VRRLALLAAAAGAGLAGCAAAPRAPPAAAQIVAPAAWRTQIGPGAAMERTWWEGFNDPALSRLVAAAIARNTDIATAAGRVEEAEAQTRISRAALLPALEVVVPGQRARTLNDLGIVTQATSIQPELEISYEVDLWGRLRKLDAASRARLQASQAGRDATALSVAAATANAYLTLRALDARLDTAKATLEARRGALRLAASRARVGYTSQLELDQADAEYQGAVQLAPQAELAVTRQEDALRVLIGETPGPVARGAPLDSLRPPPIPSGLPSDLLRRRPDIAEAEAQLVAADASYAASRAQLLPRVQLSGAAGALGVQGLDPIRVWSLGGSVLAPLFNGGGLRAEADVARSRRDQAAFAYRATALKAFREVEDALAGVQRSTEIAKSAALQQDAAAKALHIAHNRYQAGYSPYLDELDAQRTLLSAQLATIQARADTLSAYVSLYQAMGGGWTPAGG